MALFLAHVLAILSALLGALFVLGMLRPRTFMAVVRSVLGGPGVAGAVAARLLLAALLWFSAPVSSTPGAFRILATVMLVAAVSAAMLGTDRIARLVECTANWRPVFVRLPIAVGVVLCVFMLWSVAPAIGGF